MDKTMTDELKAPWHVRGDSAIINRAGDIVLKDETLARAIRLASAVNIATADERGETPFVIWSNEHRGWWGPNRCGYPPDIRDAGCYSRVDAEAICYDAGPGSREIPNEIMLRKEDALRSTRWHAENPPKRRAL